MMEYFNQKESMLGRSGDKIKEVLETIAWRYIGANPAHPFCFCVFQEEGFGNLADGRFDLDLNKKFPDSEMGDYVWIKGRFFKEVPAEDRVKINCFGPVTIWLNGELLFKSTVREEVNHTVHAIAVMKGKGGWNEITFCCQKTTSGFGCLFGSVIPKWRWQNIFAPAGVREGRLGFIYSEPVKHPDDEPAAWYPRVSWGEEEASRHPVKRLFGAPENKYIYAWSKIRINTATEVLHFCSDAPARLWIDGCEIVGGQISGCEIDGAEINGAEIDGGRAIPLTHGEYQVLLRYQCPAVLETGYRLYAKQPENEFVLPENIEGADNPWLYAGPFDEPIANIEQRATLYQLLGEEQEADSYWKVDLPGGVVRPVLENLLFARWNYPLGVTLYGLIKTARFLDNQPMLEYVHRHIGECVKLYSYSLWEKHAYGYPYVNIQIANMDMLDDCGSFGNAILELDSPDLAREISEVTEDIADYLEHDQERREDGAFYRICKGSFMEDTLWADDLYMSVPFLCRYYRKSGNDKYLLDAVNQFKQYKKYLFMEEQNIASHVYDFKYNVQTRVPWGRGNGWVLFSLAELLTVISPDHEDYAWLIEFYRELADGYLNCQTADGLWHQVLTDPTSYPEASCTAMFIYGLCHGLRLGWLREDQQNRAQSAVEMGWRGLLAQCVDYHGNIYGVSAGSDYSFKPEYYRDELPWVINDPHGTGIVMLAGIELYRLTQAQAK